MPRPPALTDLSLTRAVAAAMILSMLPAVGATPRIAWALDLASATEATNTVRALHGINGGPICYRGTVDLRDRHRELAIPLTRLHDTVWVNAEAVDVHTIFRDFRNDPADPGAYDFRGTDDYLGAVQDTGAEVVFRLGESIEHTPTKYWVHPPSDPAKWAAIATAIVAHYHAGWAGGPHRAVRYWEIWNEPENRPSMWTGTNEQFLELYERTARSIKDRFPDARVGGPGFGSVGELKGDRLEPSGFALQFLRHCRSRAVPLDFFSWHLYTDDLGELQRLSTAVRALLDAEGFPRAESHLNEWNYLPDRDWAPMLGSSQGSRRDAWFARMNGPEGAAFALGALLSMQDLPVTAANYFTGEVQGFGLFHFSGAPKDTFHAFRAFRDLLSTPLRLPVRTSSPAPPRTGLTTVAAAGRNAAGTAATFAAALMAPKPADEAAAHCLVQIERLPWKGPTRWELRRIGTGFHPDDPERGVSEDPSPLLEFHAATPGVVIIRLESANDNRPSVPPIAPPRP